VKGSLAATDCHRLRPKLSRRDETYQDEERL
jgi:hypothetical protein